jgi:tRNA(Ile)-lysidine synthase TilS/MesJ
MDDAVNTFLMSLIYEGRISCFEPVTYMDRTGITQIRPMLYAEEKQVSALQGSTGCPSWRAPAPWIRRAKENLSGSLQEA